MAWPYRPNDTLIAGRRGIGAGAEQMFGGAGKTARFGIRVDRAGNIGNHDAGTFSLHIGTAEYLVLNACGDDVINAGNGL